MTFANLLRHTSLSGLLLMFGGMGLVFYEVQSGYLLQRMGMTGHIGSILCGTSLSVWGLKEIVAHIWSPRGRRGHHFRLPFEGFSYLVIMIVLFIAANLAQSNLLLMVFSVLAGSFIVNGWLTFTMLRDARVSRDLPERIMVGETLTVTLTLENRNSWFSAWLMTLHDSIHHAGSVMSPEVVFVRVPPRSSRTGAYHFCPLERGEFEFTHLDATTRFPLGMVERGIGRDVRQRLLVYPRLGHLRPEWRRLIQNATELVNLSRPNSGTYQDEMHRIREFRPGDDLRKIHWRTSARMNELMVCDYQECRDRDLFLIVDAWLPIRPSADESEQFERGLRFAATICMQYLRSSRQSSLTVRLLGKEHFDWFGDSGKQHADSLLDAFAMLEPSHRTEYQWEMGGLSPNWFGQIRTLVISPRSEAVMEEFTRAYPGTLLDLRVIGTSEEELNEIFDDVTVSREQVMSHREAEKKTVLAETS